MIGLKRKKKKIKFNHQNQNKLDDDLVVKITKAIKKKGVNEHDYFYSIFVNSTKLDASIAVIRDLTRVLDQPIEAEAEKRKLRNLFEKRKNF